MAGTPIGFGEPAPLFRAATPTNPRFEFGSIGGRYIVLAFLPPGDTAALAVWRVALAEHRASLDDFNRCAFGVLTDAAAIATAEDDPPGVRWFLDADRAVTTLYRAEDAPHLLLIDPSLRRLATAPVSEASGFLRAVAGLGRPDDHAQGRLTAPVLIAPRIFEPAFCRALIAYYEATGGSPSGVTVERDGVTMVQDNTRLKRRSDVLLGDRKLIAEATRRLARRLVPEIQKAFQFTATQIERHLVACYDAADSGFFGRHRDNTTKGTAHRRFAVTINLNAGEYAGGDLRFPEFGSATYRAPTGGAAVFSCSLLHEATPVTEGRRYAYLPFLYDDASAALRERNMQYLSDDLRTKKDGEPG